ncbi:hypothetical protein [Polyangium jinanense]|uniref:Secreted protein n=1 Tax=Polyangium jinanense TaxID=2829994 RepID=A0A9X3XDQ6_9BACT|nr:hypothetical protein [Polyangium jinanense]MDC3959998.1 hypothetical protein [Polyangium jinanense]MDC3986216.1 hypothetical protein [Polyangium jinanense]
MKHGAHWILPSMTLAALLMSGCAGTTKPADSPAEVKGPGAEPAAVRDPNAGCQVDNCDPKNTAEH